MKDTRDTMETKDIRKALYDASLEVLLFTNCLLKENDELKEALRRKENVNN